eukprot:364033-Hanusia_phi.AAC.2
MSLPLSLLLLQLSCCSSRCLPEESPEFASDMKGRASRCFASHDLEQPVVKICNFSHPFLTFQGTKSLITGEIVVLHKVSEDTVPAKV